MWAGGREDFGKGMAVGYTMKLHCGLHKHRRFSGFGRGGKIRTYDPLAPNQMRYQTALRPDCSTI